MLLYCYSILLLFCAFQKVHSDNRNPLSAPQGGEVVELGKSYTIQWKAGSPGSVKIWLAYENTDPVAVSDWISNSGTFGWFLQNYDPRNDYFIAICDEERPAHDCTNSTEFSIASVASSTLSSASSTLFTSTTATSSSSTNIVTKTTTSSISTSIPSPSQHSNLSPGAKIAVGTVCGVVGAGLVALAALWFWYKNKRRREEENLTLEEYHYGGMRPVLNVGADAEWSRPTELPAREFLRR